MPIGPWAIPAISSVASLLESYLGSRKQKQGYEMSPYEQMIINALLKEYQGEVPSYVTAPYVREAKNIEQQHARRAGSSGLVPALKQRYAYAPMSEAIKGYKGMQLSQLAGLTRGTGTQWTQGNMDIGEPVGDIGWLLWTLTQEKEGEGKKKGGTAYPGGYYPSSY